LLPDSNDWKDSSRPPSISLPVPSVNEVCKYEQNPIAHPLSAKALFSLEYRSLTPLDAEFATSDTELALAGPIPPPALLLVAAAADLCGCLGEGIGLSGPPTAHTVSSTATHHGREALTQGVDLLAGHALARNVPQPRAQDGRRADGHGLGLGRDCLPAGDEVDRGRFVRRRSTEVEERSVLLLVDESACVALPFDVVAGLVDA
jgi:hypothetical protein